MNTKGRTPPEKSGRRMEVGMHLSAAAPAPTRGYGEFAAEYAAFAAALRGEALPFEVTEAVRINLLDTLACATAGCTAPGVADVAALATEWGGAPQALIWGSDTRIP